MVIDMNTELFRKTVTESSKPVLVEFWAPWCVYCRRVGPVFDKLADQLSDSLIFGKVNVDEEKRLAVEEEIEVIPTLVLYKDGQAIGAVTAPESKASIEAFIRETLDREGQ